MIAVTLRAKLKFFCVAVCVVSAVLCAMNGAALIAAALVIAGLVVWRTRFGAHVATVELIAVNRRLSEARIGRSELVAPATIIRAAVTPQMICLRLAETPKRWWNNASITFRDEHPATLWRALATRLRHQPRPSNERTPHAGTSER